MNSRSRTRNRTRARQQQRRSRAIHNSLIPPALRALSLPAQLLFFSTGGRPVTHEEITETVSKFSHLMFPEMTVDTLLDELVSAGLLRQGTTSEQHLLTTEQAGL